MLKNVHLAPQWLVQLEKKLHNLTPHPSFRLFLTMEINPKVIHTYLVLLHDIHICEGLPPHSKFIKMIDICEHLYPPNIHEDRIDIHEGINSN